MNNKILGGLMAVGLTLSACSSDDADDTTTTSPASAATTAAPASDPPETDPTETTETTEASATTEPAVTDSTTDEPTAGAAGLDPDFGTDGVANVAVSATDNDRFISIVEGVDGQIYASGFTAIGEDHLFAVSRFNPDGTPDETWGEAGTASVNVTVDGGSAEVARGLVIADDGTVLVSGPFEKDPAAEGDAAGDLDVAVLRFTTEGALDTTFGDAGIATFDLGAGRTIDAETYLTDNAWGLTAREGGYALFGVTPNQEADRTDTDYAIVGITADGGLDSAFGTDGVLIADVDASDDSARNIATQPDGSIVATGYSRDGDGIVSPVLIRASTAGVLDETFGTGGIANHIILPGVAESYSFALQGDDYILAGYGRGEDSEEKVDMVVYRFLADGTWDETFGTDGVTRINIADFDDRARNVTILPDGNILAIGSGIAAEGELDAMAVMLDADGAPVETFGEGGHLLVDLGGPGDAFFGVTVSADETAVLLAGFVGADPDGDANDDAVLARIAL